MKLETANRPNISIEAVQLEEVLFPNGTNFDHDQQKLLFEEYKVMVNAYDQLAARRQAVNGFFLSLNTFMLAGVGFIFKESLELFVHEHKVTNLMILTIALALIGLVVDSNWSALLASYSRLVRSQMRVIEALEKHLVAALMTAQAVSHRKELHSLSDLERNIARTFQVIFALCGVGAVALMVIAHLIPAPQR